jgi:hypothetical protein
LPLLAFRPTGPKRRQAVTTDHTYRLSLRRNESMDTMQSLTERPRRIMNLEAPGVGYLAEHTFRGSPETGTRYTEAL